MGWSKYPLRSFLIKAKNGSALNVEWSDGEKSNFNFMWLRDNCPTAHDKDSRHRMFNILKVSQNISPKNIMLILMVSLKLNGVRESIKAIMIQTWFY